MLKRHATNTFSTNKIIILTLSLFVQRIMTSLFIFHLHNQFHTTSVIARYWHLFPVPREIKSFELITADKTTFSKKIYISIGPCFFWFYTLRQCLPYNH